MQNRKDHWNKVYETKKPTEVSWYEAMPEVSLKCITDCKIEKDAAIIDIGGGDSFLAEFLLAQGYTDVTVVDISEKALERAKKRLGNKAEAVTWIIADVSNFQPQRMYDVWHDRAVFHFLTQKKEILNYLDTVNSAVNSDGFLIMGTFSENGPLKCSGLEIKQYSIAEMQELFADNFKTLSCRNIDHKTPSGGIQNFTFCSFEKRSN